MMQESGQPEGSRLVVAFRFTAHLCHAGVHGCSELCHLIQRPEKVSFHAGHLGALACTQATMHVVRDQARKGSTVTELAQGGTLLLLSRSEVGHWRAEGL